VEQKACSKDTLLLVNESVQVSHVSPLPVTSGPEGSKLSVTGLVQAPTQNTDRKGLESPRMLHTHLPLRWHCYTM